MDPKDKALTVLIVVLTVIALAVRTQSREPSTLHGPLVATSNDGAISLPLSRGLTPIQDSRIPNKPTVEIDVAPTTIEQVRGEGVHREEALLEDPYSTEVEDVDEPFVVLDDPVAHEPELYMPYPDEAQIADPWSLSDQELITEMISIFNAEQVAAFRAMWSELTASERREWLEQLRMSMLG